MTLRSKPGAFPVFVYGTLRQGSSRFRLTHHLEVWHPEAFLPGFQMLDLGSFPGIIPGEGEVRGEIHLYSSFEELDYIEGYREQEPEASLYLRRLVEVELPSSDHQKAFTYVFNSRRLRRDFRVVESGDWYLHQGLYRKAAL